MIRYGFFLAIFIFSSGSLQCQMSDSTQPAIEEAAAAGAVEASPQPLVLENGESVSSVADWESKRRPELLELFATQMYGHMPPAPEVSFELEDVDPEFMEGKATKKLITLSFGPEGTPPINLLLVIPNASSDLPPVFLGLNFYGNHAALDDPSIRLTEHWVPERGTGVVDNRATDAARGSALDRWSIADVIERGYASATFYHADVDPDKDDFSDGVHASIPVNGSVERSDESWGTIAAWAWGMHRAVDYLVRDPDVDGSQIAVMGHSRNGKAALLAGATDDRIALVISNQSGCGGAALSKRKVGETVAAINDRFPHWFNRNFRQYNDNEDALPLDQHLLIGLIAPRPVLVASAREDAWADPEGEFLALAAAEPVYKLYGKAGLNEKDMPALNTLVGVDLGYHIRPGGHGVGIADWNVFMDFAEQHFGRPASSM